MQERNRRKRERWKMLPSNRECLRIFPLCREKRQIGISSHLISSFFFLFFTLPPFVPLQASRLSDEISWQIQPLRCCAVLSLGTIWAMGFFEVLELRMKWMEWRWHSYFSQIFISSEQRTDTTALRHHLYLFWKKPIWQKQQQEEIILAKKPSPSAALNDGWLVIHAD